MILKAFNNKEILRLLECDEGEFYSPEHPDRIYTYEELTNNYELQEMNIIDFLLLDTEEEY